MSTILPIPNVEAILAVDLKDGLSKDGQIPWKCKKDLSFFKDKTINNVVVMGSHTFLSLPNKRPLNNRVNIILTNSPEKYSKLYENDNNVFFVNFTEALDMIYNKYSNKTVYIIGGNKVIQLFWCYCNKLWLTRIKKDYDCDLFLEYNHKLTVEDCVYDDDILNITCFHL